MNFVYPTKIPSSYLWSPIIVGWLKGGNFFFSFFRSIKSYFVLVIPVLTRDNDAYYLAISKAIKLISFHFYPLSLISYFR